MLRILIRLTSVAFGLLVAVLSWLTVSMVQLSLPLGSQEGAVVLASQTSLGRESWIAGLDRIAAETSTDIFLMAPGQEDYLGRRDIFRFGPAQGQASAHWLMPGLEGPVRPSQELGETSLNTSYALRGPAQGRAAVKDWMASAGIRTNWNTYHSTLVSMSLVGLPILVYASTLVLLSTVVMSWYAQRARSRAVRVISGMSGSRLQLQDLVGFARDFLPGLVVTLALVMAALAVWKGLPASSAVGAGTLLSTSPS